MLGHLCVYICVCAGVRACVHACVCVCVLSARLAISAYVCPNLQSCVCASNEEPLDRGRHTHTTFSGDRGRGGEEIEWQKEKKDEN